MPEPLAELGSPAVVLIGPPAAGKTRVGKRVARSLDLPFIDTDRMIVAEHGPIAQIFERSGEAHFRALEADAVSHALTHRAVIALGGGAVMTASVAEALAGHPVVLLTLTPEAASQRLDPVTRPLVRDGIDAWSALVESRMPTYRALAQATWDTSTRPIDRIASEVAQWARDRSSAQGEP
ncbi:shikimate kinase [Microcella sp.]|uniref:shikimate kinase n=1 Tax=Microcella sp. TaxID=1913979 RepID=UPI0026243B18|nr:shikimate kinase [Microcella sp.]